MFTSCKQNDDNEDTPVVLEAADTFRATAGSTTVTAGDAIALSVAQATANTKAYTESLSYAWTKTVGSTAAESITLSNGKYTTIAADAGSVVFTCKITSASNATGVTVATSAVTVNVASTVPALTISGDAISVIAGGAVSATITGTLTNESFGSGVTVAAGGDLSSYVTLSDASFLAAGYTITAAEAIAGGATSAKITVAGTAAASAASGTFTVTISGASLASGVALTSSNTIAYEVTAGTSVTPFTEYFDKYNVDGTSTYGTVWTSTAATVTGTTVYFASGVTINNASDFKGQTKAATIGSYTTTACLQLGKIDTGSYISIPVTGNSTICIAYSNNKAPNVSVRGLLATASASGATVQFGTGTAATTAFYSDDSTLTVATPEVLTLNYVGTSGTIKLQCAQDAAGTNPAGACYIYVIELK
jgi:hypothetical protein